MSQTGIETAYENLANAIVEKAAEDYKNAYTMILRGNTRKNYKDTAQECREFFLSDWFDELSGLDGQRLLNMIQEECERLEGWF